MVYKQTKKKVCVRQIKSMVCRGMTYHLCPVSGCPSCADKQHRTSNPFEEEHARCMALLENENDSGSPGFSGWQTPYRASRSSNCPNAQHYLCNTCFHNWSLHNDKSLIPTYVRQCILCQAEEPDARVHPHTRNRGNAAPAKEAHDLTEEERDTELWFSNWQQTKDKCTQNLAQVNCPNLAAVMTVLYKSSSIGKTTVAPSGFVPPAIGGRLHHGLFVKGNCVVNPGEICAVMCSNEEYFDIEPTDRQSTREKTPISYGLRP